METLTLINGNKQIMNKELPRIIILQEAINEAVIEQITENTNLVFTKESWQGYGAQPTESRQIASLLLTYNFKTEYHDNATNHNILFLKFCNIPGFKVESVCFDCLKRNNISTMDLKHGDILAC